jgi:hypothetical protein
MTEIMGSLAVSSSSAFDVYLQSGKLPVIMAEYFDD